jgi:hypothetical protein
LIYCNKATKELYINIVNLVVFMSIFIDNTQIIQPIKGRGTASKMAGRFAITLIEADENDEAIALLKSSTPKGQVRYEKAKTTISHNSSPDLPFTQSLTPCKGCEHGCIFYLRNAPI